MTALRDLKTVFAQRADGVKLGSTPLVGLFGDGLPEALVRGAGADCADVKAPPLDDHISGPNVDAVDEIAEPFLDVFAARFLHRFAAGAFDDFALIVFSRDDAAGLAAYQYATELRRLGHVAATGPRLFLWNLLHTKSDPARIFNAAQWSKLEKVLAETTGLAPDPARRAAAHEAEAARAAAILRVADHDEAFVLRNSGRWLAPQAHIALLDQVPLGRSSRQRQVGLVGTACDIDALHSIAQAFGRVAVDLTPYGDIWPNCHVGAGSVDALLDHVASAPLHIRTNPPERFCAALDASLMPCDVILSSVDANDDSFGWEVPRLAAGARVRGQVFVDLGFRPFRPDAAWIAQARGRIEKALT